MRGQVLQMTKEDDCLALDTNQQHTETVIFGRHLDCVFDYKEYHMF